MLENVATKVKAFLNTFICEKAVTPYPAMHVHVASVIVPQDLADTQHSYVTPVFIEGLVTPFRIIMPVFGTVTLMLCTFPVVKKSNLSALVRMPNI